MKIQQSIYTTLYLVSHHTDRELLNAAISTYKKEHRGEFWSAGSYERKMISPDHFDSQNADDSIISIPRIRPKASSGDERDDEDSATHSITADLLIPYSSYTIRFVLLVLYAGLHRSGTIDQLCDNYHISHSTYYSWKRLFEAHYRSWERSLRKANKVCDDLLSAMQSIPELPWRFLSTFSVSFLQSRYNNYSILAPVSSGEPVSPG